MKFSARLTSAKRSHRDRYTRAQRLQEGVLRVHHRTSSRPSHGSGVGDPPSKAARHTTADPLAIGRVVAPIDLAGGWQSDAIRAARVAAGFGAELMLVHVLAEVQTPPWLRSTTGRADRRRTEAARKALDRVKAKLSPRLETLALVREGNPADAIARLTVGSPTLVVMSLRGGAGVWGARRLDRYHVLTHSSTPVLTLPRRRLGGRFTASSRRRSPARCASATGSK